MIVLVRGIIAPKPGRSFALGMEAPVAVDPAVPFGAVEEVDLGGAGMIMVPKPRRVPVASHEKPPPLDAVSVDGVGDVAPIGDLYRSVRTASGSRLASSSTEAGPIGAWTLPTRSEEPSGSVTVPVASNPSSSPPSEGPPKAVSASRDLATIAEPQSLKGSRVLPIRVPDLEDVVAISAGIAHMLALTSDGTLWAWGDNTDGQVGSNSQSVTVTSPVPVMVDVDAFAAGGQHSLARTGNGAVWAWGYNAFGQVGDGTRNNRRGPFQVIAPTGP